MRECFDFDSGLNLFAWPAELPDEPRLAVLLLRMPKTMKLMARFPAIQFGPPITREQWLYARGLFVTNKFRS